MFTDIKKLMTFVAIAETKSFTGAAERLHVAQPWVSVQLKQLEEMLDSVLIERSKGKLVKLSPCGREFLPIAKRLLKSCEETDREIVALRDRGRARLVVGVDPATLYMPERNNLVRRFLDQMPETELRIASAQPCELFDGLRSGDLDLILTLCPAPDDDIELMPLYEYELQFLIPKSNAQQYANFEQEELQGATVMILPDSYHPAFFAWLKETLGSFNIRWKECPEVSFNALIRYAAMLGVATLYPDFSRSIPEISNEMDIRAIKSRPTVVRWALMRRRGDAGRAQDCFWQMAAQSRQEAHIQPMRDCALPSGVLVGAP